MDDNMVNEISNVTTLKHHHCVLAQPCWTYLAIMPGATTIVIWIGRTRTTFFFAFLPSPHNTT